MPKACELHASDTCRPRWHRAQAERRVRAVLERFLVAALLAAGSLVASLPVHADAFDGPQTGFTPTQQPAPTDPQSGAGQADVGLANVGLANVGQANAQGNVQAGAPGDGHTADITGLILPLLGAMCLAARRRYSDRRG